MTIVSSSRAPSRLPPVDAHIVAEGSGYEIIEGRLVAVPAAHEPHGERHSKLNALLEAFVGDAHSVACDMLTRVSEASDIAPDASVYPIARDPETGRRQLEVLAFQVVATETLARAAEKAALLARRGVRRVFAVDVERQRALEWSSETGGWQVLPDAGTIEDEVFVAPLPVHARGLPITAAEQARIEACRDLDALTRWTARAVHAASVDEVLDDDRGETPG